MRGLLAVRSVATEAVRISFVPLLLLLEGFALSVLSVLLLAVTGLPLTTFALLSVYLPLLTFFNLFALCVLVAVFCARVPGYRSRTLREKLALEVFSFRASGFLLSISLPLGLLVAFLLSDFSVTLVNNAALGYWILKVADASSALGILTRGVILSALFTCCALSSQLVRHSRKKAFTRGGVR